VLKDIKATQKQRAQVGDLLKNWDAKRQNSFVGFHRLGPDERQRLFADLARTNEAAIAEILVPAQLHRFRQIAVQCKGPLAFHEPEIVAALKLTSEQKKELRAIEGVMFVDTSEFERPGPPGSPARKAQEDRRKLAMKQILKLLTDDQAKRWRELTGEPFLSPDPIFLPHGPPRDGPPRKGPPRK
jgi:hypothetical protein